MTKMNDFTVGEQIWLLEPPNTYRKTPKEYISKCIYRGKFDIGDFSSHSLQRINTDGGLGLTFDIGKDYGYYIFSTLDELKDYIIRTKLNDISNLQRSINNIHNEINEIKSLKDIIEDREKKLNEIL